MADTVHTEDNAPAVDMTAHVRDWTRMKMMLKWGAVAAFIVAAIVVLLISN